jgi:hypothetical protein
MLNRTTQATLFAIAITWLVLAGLTIRAVYSDGLTIAPFIYFSDFVFPWRAQFNFDFLGYLAIGSSWIVYREPSRVRGLIFAGLHFLCGGMFLLPYLAVLIYLSKGNLRSVLLGHRQ